MDFTAMRSIGSGRPTPSASNNGSSNSRGSSQGYANGSGTETGASGVSTISKQQPQQQQQAQGDRELARSTNCVGERGDIASSSFRVGGSGGGGGLVGRPTFPTYSSRAQHQQGLQLSNSSGDEDDDYEQGMAVSNKRTNPQIQSDNALATQRPSSGGLQGAPFYRRAHQDPHHFQQQRPFVQHKQQDDGEAAEESAAMMINKRRRMTMTGDNNDVESEAADYIDQQEDTRADDERLRQAEEEDEIEEINDGDEYFEEDPHWHGTTADGDVDSGGGSAVQVGDGGQGEYDMNDEQQVSYGYNNGENDDDEEGDIYDSEALRREQRSGTAVGKRGTEFQAEDEQGGGLLDGSDDDDEEQKEELYGKEVHERQQQEGQDEGEGDTERDDDDNHQIEWVDDGEGRDGQDDDDDDDDDDRSMEEEVLVRMASKEGKARSVQEGMFIQKHQRTQQGDEKEHAYDYGAPQSRREVEQESHGTGQDQEEMEGSRRTENARRRSSVINMTNQQASSLEIPSRSYTNAPGNNRYPLPLFHENITGGSSMSSSSRAMAAARGRGDDHVIGMDPAYEGRLETVEEGIAGGPGSPSSVSTSVDGDRDAGDADKRQPAASSSFDMEAEVYRSPYPTTPYTRSALDRADGRSLRKSQLLHEFDQKRANMLQQLNALVGDVQAYFEEMREVVDRRFDEAAKNEAHWLAQNNKRQNDLDNSLRKMEAMFQQAREANCYDDDSDDDEDT